MFKKIVDTQIQRFVAYIREIRKILSSDYGTMPRNTFMVSHSFETMLACAKRTIAAQTKPLNQ